MIHYPWDGEFKVGNPESPVAVVTLADEMDLPGDRVAIYGKMKTENLGIEKVVANVVANPNVRFLVICGREVRGHRSGDTLMALHSNGVDGARRVVSAKGAVPYIENLPDEAIARFQAQVEIVNLIDVTDMERILAAVEKAWSDDPGSFGEPYVVELRQAERKAARAVEGQIALHSSLTVDPYGQVSSLEHVPEGG